MVKFVDRTYNLNPERYIKIWQYILQNHNQKTMFHFEIEAEFLSEEALEFLQTVPANVMQFEIGVQSANKKTLQSICRSTGIEKIAQNVKRIPPTIHKHLDLIAGLPQQKREDFFIFPLYVANRLIFTSFLYSFLQRHLEPLLLANYWIIMPNLQVV